MESLVILASLGFFFSSPLLAESSSAAQSVASTNQNLEQVCLQAKKAKALCACIARNMNVRARLGGDSSEQMAEAVNVMRGDTTAERNSAQEPVADYLAGLEYHCQENPKYSIE